MKHTSSHFPRRVGVVSSAQTEWRSAWSAAQHIDLISAAVQQALEGSGLSIDDVDFIIDSGSGSDILDGRSISNCGFLGAMGAHHKEESRVEDDGLRAALYGVNKIASGAAEVDLGHRLCQAFGSSTVPCHPCDPFMPAPRLHRTNPRPAIRLRRDYSGRRIDKDHSYSGWRRHRGGTARPEAGHARQGGVEGRAQGLAQRYFVLRARRAAGLRTHDY